jgi:hypothetical protein
MGMSAFLTIPDPPSAIRYPLSAIFSAFRLPAFLRNGIDHPRHAELVCQAAEAW